MLFTIPLLLNASICMEGSFKKWTTHHEKTYASDSEYQYRLSIYKKNLDFIENHNRLNLGYTVAMNKYGDLTPEEITEIYLTPVINVSLEESVNSYQHDPLYALADTVDWRTKGVVTAVKNQGQCGSCWAFSTTGSVEGAWGIKKGTLVSLSEQNLVDCSGRYGNYGCNGGLMDSAFKYIIANKGIDTEASYKYTAKDGTCKYSSANIGATISSYKDVGKSEAALQSAIQSIGPISVAIDASKSSFHFYSSGVYYEAACSSTRLDHGVLAVGFGTSTADYYIVKNSWGTDWGMQGYILMSRNKNNNCGIATMSSYPIV